MSTPYERLVIAGAPKIEEPLFYRIKFADSGDLAVEIRERNRRFGSSVVSSSTVKLSAYPADKVLSAVVGALFDCHARIALGQRVSSLIGDHGGRA